MKIGEQLKRVARVSLRLHVFLFLAGIFAVAGCGDGDESSGGPSSGGDTSQVKIFAEDRSDAVEGAQVRITSPKNEDALDEGTVSLVFEVSGLELGVQTQSSRAGEIANSDSGQHVHLIVNGGPYSAHYEDGEDGTVELKNLKSGLYTVLAFPSRSYHESFKNTGASDLINFCVQNPQGGCIERTHDVRADGGEGIFYSRPKGEYSGAGAEKIMLDFYLRNLKLSEDGPKAKYTVTKKDETDKSWSIVLDEWKPAFITGLESGTYIVRLDLVEVVDPPVNYSGTEREITVVAE